MLKIIRDAVHRNTRVAVFSTAFSGYSFIYSFSVHTPLSTLIPCFLLLFVSQVLMFRPSVCKVLRYLLMGLWSTLKQTAHCLICEYSSSPTVALLQLVQVGSFEFSI